MNNLWKEIRQQLGEFRSPMSEGLVEGRLARKLLADADALLGLKNAVEDSNVMSINQERMAGIRAAYFRLPEYLRRAEEERS